MRVNLRLGARPRTLAAASAVAAALGGADAFAYGEQGFYTGAYAMVGEGGCSGAAGMGIDPTGGCTPGVDALIHSEAFVYGARGELNYSEGVADLPSASLVARSVFPDGASNVANGAANLTDTITLEGPLPANDIAIVAMLVESDVSGGSTPESGFGGLSVRLSTDDGETSGTSYFQRDPTCAFAGVPCWTGVGPRWRLIERRVIVNDANRTFRIDASLTATSVGNTGHHGIDGLARLRLLVPDGVSVSSASGVFATVPEPSQAAVLPAVAGALGIVHAFRRRRRGARPRPD